MQQQHDLTVFTATDSDRFAHLTTEQVDAFLSALRDPNALATVTRPHGSVYYPTHAVQAVKVEPHR